MPITFTYEVACDVLLVSASGAIDSVDSLASYVCEVLSVAKENSVKKVLADNRALIHPPEGGWFMASIEEAAASVPSDLAFYGARVAIIRPPGYEVEAHITAELFRGYQMDLAVFGKDDEAMLWLNKNVG